MNPQFVYSRDECAAYVAAIVRAFEKHHTGKPLGRKALHKLAYFSKELGAAIPCSFEIYTYGPYSDTLTFTVDSLQADDVLTDESSDSKYYNYRLGASATEFFREWDPAIERDLSIIDDVVQTLGGFTPNELELIATLHFVAQRQRFIRRMTPSRDTVVAEFRDIKKDKFSLETINGWYDALHNAHLI
jgi:uncharacterized protein